MTNCLEIFIFSPTIPSSFSPVSSSFHHGSNPFLFFFSFQKFTIVLKIILLWLCCFTLIILHHLFEYISKMKLYFARLRNRVWTFGYHLQIFFAVMMDWTRAQTPGELEKSDIDWREFKFSNDKPRKWPPVPVSRHISLDAYGWCPQSVCRLPGREN